MIDEPHRAVSPEAGAGRHGADGKDSWVVTEVPDRRLCLPERTVPETPLEPPHLAERTRICAELLRRNRGVSAQVLLLARAVHIQER